MSFATGRYVRGLVISLMFLLAGNAYCTSDSYDPDPYDNVPPLITVDFNYVVPSVITARQHRPHVENRQSLALTAQWSPLEVTALAVTQSIQPDSEFGQSSPQIQMPLRR